MYQYKFLLKLEGKRERMEVKSTDSEVHMLC